MFSAYWLSISEINLPKTVERTSENKNVFLAKDAAIVLTGSAPFSATCCCKFVSENLFSGTWLPLKKKLPECTEMERNESHFLIYNYFFERSYVTLVWTLIDQLFYEKSEWMIKWVDEWVCLIDWVSEELYWLIDLLIEWVSEKWVSTSLILKPDKKKWTMLSEPKIRTQPGNTY